MVTKASQSNLLSIVLLIFAGEMIFSLPFHITRFFRPTMLEAFNLSNAQLGDLFAAYGIAAMLSYFPGGALADRFAPKNLIAFSLIATALGGLYFIQYPSQFGLALLYAYWGVTTILLFWAAMLKATRDWGGDHNQGKAFGFLDGGRGLMAATIATLAAWLFAQLIPEASETLTNEQRKSTLNVIIYFYSGMTLLAATLIYFFLPNNQVQSAAPPVKYSLLICKEKVIWLQAIIVICAYCAFKGIDNYSLYAVKIMNLSESQAATLVSVTSFSRPIAAVAFGLLADKLSPSKIIALGFVFAIASYAFISSANPESTAVSLLLANMFVTLIAAYGIRGVYFALIKESGVARHSTGAAVGFVSLLGFTPDVFFGSISGRILDANPGLTGFQNYFLLLCGFAIVGFVASVVLNWLNQHQSKGNLSYHLRENYS